ncbi:hypothetical protein EZS27_019681 [termite gut metagenome]|uniref:Capsular polysaccharide synthesis protein n=1 Tax=termite gut metagenome TaxID=433724 RepID=A0A5J4RDJ6_9ZZZZ
MIIQQFQQFVSRLNKLIIDEKSISVILGNNYFIISMLRIFTIKFIRINKLSDYLKQKQSLYIINYLQNTYSNIIEIYKNIKTKNNIQQIPRNVYVCWLQGEENAPIIVKKCIDNIRMSFPTCNIIILTEKNWRSYCSLPIHILDKYKNNIITPTHFSDILRLSLLSNNGGLWIDATVLVTNSISMSLFECDFFSIANSSYSDNISRRRWTTYLLAADKDSIIVKFVYDMLCEYWKNENIAINYYFMDYIFHIGYIQIEHFRNIINSIPKSNPNCLKLSSLLNQPFDKNIWESITKDTYFHKLSWKIHLNDKYSNDTTFWNYIEEHF